MDQHLTVAGYLVHDGKVLLIHHRKLDLWLPVGGHIEGSETLDDALKREFLEEVGVKVDMPQLQPIESWHVTQLATPFHSNRHSVKDHDHTCMYYLCTSADPGVRINEELKAYRWFSRDELHEDIVPEDVRNQAIKALELHRTISKPT